MKKEIAAIYCRLSVEDAEKRAAESESIRNQRALLLGYAKKQGWAVYDIYADEDYSGLREDRPAFQRLLTDAEERKFSIILCKTQSRFTRNAGTAEKYLHALFPLWGVRFVTVVDGVDTASHANKKARQINSLVNEWYSEELSENIVPSFAGRWRQGSFWAIMRHTATARIPVAGITSFPMRKRHPLWQKSMTCTYRVFPVK